MSEISKKEKKRIIINNLYEAFTKYKQVLVVKLDNVSSNQIQQARVALRQQKKGIMIVGKNTVVCRAIALAVKAPKENEKGFDIRKDWFADQAQVARLEELLKGKVGLIFSDAPVFEIKPIIESNKKPAAAKVGMVAPLDVTIPPGPTGMDPSQISFFHALNMSTKINKGQIEITKEFRVCTVGKKVGNSESVLLQKLNIKPFSYGMEIFRVYDDGTILTPEIFNMNPSEIIGKFQNAANKIAAISLAIGQPNQLSAPHLVVNAFKNVASIALGAGLSFKALEGLQNNSGSQQAQPVKQETKVEEKKPEAKPEVKEEDTNLDLGGGGLFGDDDF
jgi:large subunit ribosomal protein LP0